jgi:predicted dehydrogenase
VYAESGSLFGGDHAEYSVEDAGIVSIVLGNGVTATVTIGRVPAVPTVGSAHSTIRVLGSHGHAAVSDEHPRVLRFAAGGASAAPIDGGGGRIAVAAFFADLVDRLLSGRSPEYTLADSLAGVAVTDAAYRSCLTGTNVLLPETA